MESTEPKYTVTWKTNVDNVVTGGTEGMKASWRREVWQVAQRECISEWSIEDLRKYDIAKFGRDVVMIREQGGRKEVVGVFDTGRMEDGIVVEAAYVMSSASDQDFFFKAIQFLMEYVPGLTLRDIVIPYDCPVARHIQDAKERLNGGAFDCRHRRVDNKYRR